MNETPTDLELTSETFAAVQSIVEGTCPNPVAAAAAVGVSQSELAAAVVRYVLSPAYSGDFLQVVGALGLTAEQMQQAAEDLESSDDADNLRRFKEKTESSWAFLSITKENVAAQSQESKKTSISRRLRSWTLPLALAASLLLATGLVLQLSKRFTETKGNNHQAQENGEKNGPNQRPFVQKNGKTNGSNGEKKGPSHVVNERPSLKLQGPAKLHVVGGERITLSWTLTASHSEKETVNAPEIWLEVDDALRKSFLHTDQLKQPQTVEGWKSNEENSLDIVLESREAIAEKAFALVPSVVQGKVRLHARFQERDATVETTLVVHQGPDVVVSSFQPDAQAKLAVHLGKDVPYGSLCIVLDFSGSMDALLGQKRKIDYVRESLENVVAKIPRDTNLSILAFGGKESQDFTWIRKPAAWDPTPENISYLRKNIAEDQLSPKSQSKSPIAEALFRAKTEGFPKLLGEKSPKVILALTDGFDTQFAGKYTKNGTDPVQIQAFMLKQFGTSDIEINMVCFNDNKQGEAARAKQQFDIIEEFDSPGIPGSFQIQTQPATLPETLEEALRPKVDLYHNAQWVPGFSKGLLATRPDQNFHWKAVPIDSSSGKDFTAKIQNLIKQDVRLRPGELMLLEILRGPAASLKLQRSLFAENAKWAQTTPNGRWLTAVLQNKLHQIDATIEQLVTVEDKFQVATQSGSILQHDHPRFVWFELADGEGDAPEGFRWHGEYGYPAPAYRLEAGTFPGNVTPKLSLWLADQQNLSPNVAETYEWDALYPGAKLNVLDQSPLVVEKRPAQPELHHVTVGKDERKGKACWVVQMSYPKDNDGVGSKVWLQPVGVHYQGEEHRYFSKAGRYVALFWGGPRPERFRVISIDRLKQLPGVQWILPTPNPKDKGPSIENLPG